jgi:hypothetical protein
MVNRVSPAWKLDYRAATMGLNCRQRAVANADGCLVPALYKKIIVSLVE